jgi:hypothetical protein
MKTSQLLTAFNLTAAACMLPVLVLVGMESLAASAQPPTGRVLDRVELHARGVPRGESHEVGVRDTRYGCFIAAR